MCLISDKHLLVMNEIYYFEKLSPCAGPQWQSLRAVKLDQERKFTFTLNANYAKGTFLFLPFL